MITIYYTVDGVDQRFSVSVPKDAFPALIAEIAAKDYYDNHDGWEDKWPLVFRLYKIRDGAEFAKLSVNYEAEPVFFAMNHD